MIFADQLLAFFRFVPLPTKPLILYEVPGIELMPYLPCAVRGAVGEKLAGPPSCDLPRPGVSHLLAAWTNKTVRGCRESRGRPARDKICYIIQSISTK